MTSVDFRTFLRFCVVGVVGFLVDTVVLYAAAPLAGWYAARMLSFLVAATATWWLNRKYTFASTAATRDRSMRHQYLSYLHAMLLGGAVNYLVYAAVILWVKVPAAPMVGVALGSCAGLFFNFVSARYFIFAARDRSAHH